MVIIDEIDSLESCLMEFIKFTVSERQCKKYGLTPPNHLDVLDEWLPWANQSYNRVNQGIALLKQQLNFNDVEHWTNTDMAINKDIKQGEQFLHQMAGFIHDVNDEWILDYEWKKQGWSVTFKPVTVGPYCERYLWSHGRRFLGMSGTILDPEIMAEDLGIEDYEYHRLNSNFPVQNRLIHVRPACNLRYDTMQQELPKLTEEVARLVNMYPGENTLVHAVSNNIRDHLVNNLPWAGVNPEIIMTHDKDNRAAQLELFKNMRGCVMISPSFDRGVDLPNDECRSVIICKMPYMNLQDKQVKARMALPKGQRWYNLRAIQSVMQMTGRAVRSKDDYCDTWILDLQFDRLLARTRHLIPKWWLDAIRREPL
jgi:Rad3-related DNA helicase